MATGAGVAKQSAPTVEQEQKMGTLVNHNEIGRLQLVPVEGGLHRVQMNGDFIENIVRRN